MERRTFLAAGVAGVAGLSGCLGRFTGGGSGSGGDGDGYPSIEFEEPPAEPTVDPSSFETVEQDGVRVPLAPIETVYGWYANRAARMVDARSETAYGAAHVEGAVLSPAPDGAGSNDPVTDWPKGDRIVCYCGCPHHLSSMRAAALIQNGYENVMVIDEGFGAWQDASYPMAGSDVGNRPQARRIVGKTAPAFAGEDAWARHEPSGQMEAGPIAADGSFDLVLKFRDVDADSVISIETPAYRFDAPLGDLVANVVTPEMAGAR